MLEVRVERLLSRRHHHRSNHFVHRHENRCGWQIQSHNLVQLNWLTANRAEYFLASLVHVVDILGEAVAVHLMRDVAG